MKFITNIIKKVMAKERKPLGRWNIDYCSVKINQKVNLSNEDHCGPCGNSDISKQVVSIRTDSKSELLKSKNI
jgi:hypothetical protein